MPTKKLLINIGKKVVSRWGNFDKLLFQSEASAISKWEIHSYFKLGQCLFQSDSNYFKVEHKLFQSVAVVSKEGNYFKIRYITCTRVFSQTNLSLSANMFVLLFHEII